MPAARRKNKKLGFKTLAALVLALAAAGLTLFLEWSDPGGVPSYLDHKVYDGLFFLRAKTGPADPPPSKDIVVVGIDDRTFEDPAFKIPQVLWNDFFAQVIAGLAGGGAKAIGLDFLLPQTMFDDRIDGYSRAWLKAFFLARQQGSPVVTGVMNIAGRQYRPEARYWQIIGTDFVGSFNLTVDSDGRVRRQQLTFDSLEGDGPGLDSFPLLLTRIQRPGFQPPANAVLIDYDPSPLPFPTFSFADVYRRAAAGDREFFQQYFKNRIVLVGETATLPRDRYLTPLSLVQTGDKTTPGVVIHAHTINTLLSGRFLREARPSTRFVIYAALALTMAFWGLFGSLKLWTTGAVALVAALTALTLRAAAGHMILLPLTGGVAAVIIGMILTFSFRYWYVDRDQRKIRAIFQRYQSPRVVQQLLDTRDEDFFLGENRHLALMFTDIRNFTTFSEKKEPAVVVRRLNEYFEAMSSVILAEGGVVDKFLGDGIMCFYGAFEDNRSPSLAAAKAAFGMLRELDSLNAKWSAAGEETFRIGIGIHAGLVKVGNIGSEKKMEYTVIGDAVNLASRLQDKTKLLGEEIIISEEVFQELGDAAEVEDKGLVDIKGRAQSRVYGLRGLKDRS